AVAGFTLANRLDAVGPNTLAAGSIYKEGTGLPPLPVTNLEYSFFRTFDLATGLPLDTNNNATDFTYVDTANTSTTAGQRLGAPGPENLTSPIQRNGTVKSSLVATCVASSAAPNRIRDFTPVTNGPQGTLSIRRKFTNTTAAAVTRLRFRIVDITTAPPPNRATADLRALTSVTSVDAQPCG